MTEQHLAIIADRLQMRERYDKAGIALGTPQYERDVFWEMYPNSPWEAAHRMLVAWTRRQEEDNNYKWKVLLATLNDLLLSCEMQVLFDKLIAINTGEAGQ